MTFDIAPWRDLYPFESRFFDRDGLKIHFVDEGEGDPIVAVHGNPSWSFYYRNLISGLRDRRRIVALDHIGCGLSDKPGAERYGYRLSDRVDDLEALLEHLDLKGGLTLMLHDWGGAIGLAYATRHPEQIKRLILFNTAAFFPPGGKSIPWTLRLIRNTPLGPLLVQGFNAFAVGATRMACAKPMPARVRRAYTAPYDSWDNRIATLRFVQDIPLDPVDPSHAIIEQTRAALPQFRDLPVLIGWGEKDFVFDLDFLEEWKRLLPNAEVRTFAGAGHYVLEDEPEAILQLVREFLDRHPISDPTP